MNRETMLGTPTPRRPIAAPAERPWWWPGSWSMGRAWQVWLMIVATYLLLYATLGREAVLAGLTAAWGSV